ncbi:hypothetical protein G6F31_018417 [Rhizopus arrhizus]|nr:hypothetical protein G6F31_018417 [Rhizopus arrhizus]
MPGCPPRSWESHRRCRCRFPFPCATGWRTGPANDCRLAGNVRRGQDARGHDLAVVRQRAPPGGLQLLVVVDLPGSLDQPRFLLAGGVGHFIARLEVARQRGDVVDALVFVLLARVLVVVAAALAAGEVVAALAPGVGGHQVDVVATHAQRQAPGLVLAIEGGEFGEPCGKPGTVR